MLEFDPERKISVDDLINEINSKETLVSGMVNANKELVLTLSEETIVKIALGDTSITEHDYDATELQTEFIILDKILPYVGVFVEGIKRRSTKYTITDNGTDTIVTFHIGLPLNTWVQLLEY